MGKLFGTDGVRGLANVELTAELAFRLGRAGAYILKRGLEESGERLKIVIGKDTRISGGMLEAALSAGICSMGVDVLQVGVIPTPGIAYLTVKEKALAGVVISASHNPFADNGIKFFGGTGFKLTDECEEEIERALAETEALPVPGGEKVGRILPWQEGVSVYLEYLQSKAVSLQGLKIVLDCANGAASVVGPQLLKSLGAKVHILFAEPDGVNINAACGSTHPEALAEAVLQQGADIGLACDGDADRLIVVDEAGKILDGDFIMVICALAMQKKGELKGNALAVTVMSNIGLFQALRKAGLQVNQTKVGDRYVLEKLLETGAVLGGEQSGHIIFLEHNTTGDSLLSAIQLLKVMQETRKPLSELAEAMERFPQVLLNVRVEEKDQVLSAESVQKKIGEIERHLGEEGRILVRPSGTEPLVRIMLEGKDPEELHELACQVTKEIDHMKKPLPI